MELDLIDKAFAEGKPIGDALIRGVRRALAVHKRLGQSIVIWRDGKVVWVPADEIPVDIEESENPRPHPTGDVDQAR